MLGVSALEPPKQIGITGQSMRPETIGEGVGSGMVKGRDGNKIIYSGTVDGGKIKLRTGTIGNFGRERSITLFPVCVPSRSHVDHILPSRPLPRVPLVNYQPLSV